MTTTLQRVGNQWGLILDPATLERSGIDETTKITISVGAEGILLTPVRTASDAQIDDLTDQIMNEHAETLRKLAL